MPDKKNGIKKAVQNQRQKSMRTQLSSKPSINAPEKKKLNIAKEDSSIRDFEKKKAANRPGKPGGSPRSYKKGGQLGQYD